VRVRLLRLDYPVLSHHRLATDRSAVRARRPGGSGVGCDSAEKLPCKKFCSKLMAVACAISFHCAALHLKSLEGARLTPG
jgi:hypothetical protein